MWDDQFDAFSTKSRVIRYDIVSRRITQAERMAPDTAVREAVAAILQHFPRG